MATRRAYFWVHALDLFLCIMFDLQRYRIIHFASRVDIKALFYPVMIKLSCIACTWCIFYFVYTRRQMDSGELSQKDLSRVNFKPLVFKLLNKEE